MLQLIRNRLSGWLASAVVLLFCIPFALWGVNYYFDANVNPAVATVNGEEILLDDFRRLMDEQRRAVKPDSPEEEKALKRELLDSLVLGQLVLGFADDSGMRISAGDVVREIQGMESFQEEGFFSQELYRQVLSYRGQFRPAEFEEQMRQDLMGRQVQAALVRSSFVLEDEARWGARMRLQSRDIAYVVFPAAELREEVAVDDEDIENYYQKHTEKYHRPEEVRIAYLELSAAGLEEEVAVEEEALQAFYERRSDDYDIEEERKLTRLYIQSPGDAEEAERERARARGAGRPCRLAPQPRLRPGIGGANRRAGGGLWLGARAPRPRRPHFRRFARPHRPVAGGAAQRRIAGGPRARRAVALRIRGGGPRPGAPPRSRRCESVGAQRRY